MQPTQPIFSNPFAFFENTKMEILWVCLAAMAVHYKQLDAAQVAFAALRETDKILYIDAIKVKTFYTP